MRALVTLVALLAPTFSYAQTATASGECGGPIELSVTGLTPGATVWAVLSPSAGATAVPAGPCAGLDLGVGDLSATAKLRADGAGRLRMSPRLPEERCGSLVTFVDAASCTATEPVVVGGPPVAEVTFQVDMTCAGVPFSTVHVTGPWAGWTPDYPLTDPDGDGIWSTTLPFEPGAAVEYKYMVDSWAAQENLVDDMLTGSSCAPITDYFSYANRLETAVDGLVLSDTYGTCGLCGSGPVEVTFEVDMRCSGLRPSVVGLPGPDVGWDFYARTLSDSDGDNIWTGRFVFEEGSALEYTIALDGWAMQENLIDDMVAGGECAPITDYFSYANRRVVIEAGATYANTYSTCEACTL